MNYGMNGYSYQEQEPLTSTIEELLMDEEMIVVCGDVLSGNKSPRRILRKAKLRETDSDFHVTCGVGVETCLKQVPKALLLNSHPELTCVMAKMLVDDVALKEDTTDGPLWKIKDTNGIIRQTILSPMALGH